MASAYTITHVNWEVLWVSNGKLKRKRIGKDLPRALALKEKAEKAGKRGVTLRSMNMAFPPPDKYADVEKVPIGRSKKTGRIVYRRQLTTPRRYQTKMRTVNRRGYFWCPYCMKLRKFIKRKGYRIDGMFVAEPHLACQMCGIMHTNAAVQRYNPIAQQLGINASGRKRRGRKQRQRRTT